MSRLSDKKKNRIKEDILVLLYENNLKGLSTYKIAEELARDDEFILSLLDDMEREGFVKNGRVYKGKRIWIMTNKTYTTYRGLI